MVAMADNIIILSTIYCLFDNIGENSLLNSCNVKKLICSNITQEGNRYYIASDSQSIVSYSSDITAGDIYAISATSEDEMCAVISMLDNTPSRVIYL